MTIYGTHNSLTGSRLLGWQRRLSWFINPFTKCQSSPIIQQYLDGIRAFDIQIDKKGDKWVASHGIAWYESTIETVHELLSKADKENKTIYLRIGWDFHWNMDNFKLTKRTQRIQEFRKVVNDIKKHRCVHILEVYVENYPGKDYTVWEKNTKKGLIGLVEKYWTTSWAKSKMKHWWQFYYYLPLPRFWSKRYFDRWWVEYWTMPFSEIGIMMTDFQHKYKLDGSDQER